MITEILYVREGSKEFHISSAAFAFPKTREEVKYYKNYIKFYGIDTIINVSDYPITPNILEFYKASGIKSVIYAPFDDRILTPEEYPKFKRSIHLIYKKFMLEKHKGVLIHCSAGINRSATVIAYIIHKTTNRPMTEIIEDIRRSNIKREKPALTNYTFQKLLMDL